MPELHWPVRLMLAGATGLVGRTLMERVSGDPDFELVALSRREVKLPSRTQMRLADTSLWPEVVHQLRPDVLICALGTTWRKAGRDEDKFRAVDERLVMELAKAAKEAGVEHFIFVSSVGADPQAKQLYLRVKGEVERALGRLSFRRLDILRPGLLRGRRQGDLRFLESIGIAVSPLADLALHGRRRKYRSIGVGRLVEAILGLARERASGRFIHEHDSMLFAAKRFAGRHE